MKRNKAFSLLALSAAASLVLGACSSDNGGSKDGGNNAGGDQEIKTVSFTTGGEEYNGYNSNMSTTYSTGNGVINDRMGVGFGKFLPDGTWTHGTEMGDYEVVSEDPLTVKYTINDKAVYQGGTPITCEDFYMDWVSQNPQWIDDAQKAAGQVDEETGLGLPLFNHVSDPDTYARAVENGPECEAGDREFTITYKDPNPDWELVVTGAMPSHVIASKVGLTKEELFQAFKNHDFEVAQKAADAWNNWYSPNAGELPPLEEAPSYGPFTYKEGGWAAGQYITLVPNPDWWGEKPGVDEFVVRFIAPEGQIQALANQDVNVIEPQATQDTLDTLKNTAGVTVLTGPTMIWEHLDFNWAEGSVFSEAQGGKALREAFALCVPRADIVDRLIKPLDPNATLMNAREYFPVNPEYDEVVKAAYDGRYDKVDIEASKAKIAESGVSNPTVRIGYSAPNQRRSDTVALIQASCSQAGFNIQDAGNADFFKPGGTMDSGNYDIALFAWSGSGQIASGANIYTTGAPQNYHGWSNPVVDEEWDRVRTSIDEDVFLEAKKKIEKVLWDELYGLPLYAHPGVVAHTEGLKNVERNTTQSGISWNAEQWTWE